MRTSVGMLRIANRPAVRGLASLSTFTSTARPCSSRAATSNCGAMMRQGPHQAAQKSTTTGSSERATNVSKLLSSNVIGVAGSSGTPQRPHTGSSRNRSPGTRLVAWHWGQATCIVRLRSGNSPGHAAGRPDFNHTICGVDALSGRA
jgi:hypothetical protein